MELAWRQTRAAWIAALPEYADDRGAPLTQPVDPAVVELCAQLLDNDGVRVCIPFVESRDFCRWLCAEGSIHSPEAAKLQLGKANDCHGNSARLWKTQPHTCHLITGYALSEHDGMWRRHSWVIDMDNHIIETTEERYLYYGIKLEPSYAQSFADVYA